MAAGESLEDGGAHGWRGEGGLEGMFVWLVWSERDLMFKKALLWVVLLEVEEIHVFIDRQT